MLPGVPVSRAYDKGGNLWTVCRYDTGMRYRLFRNGQYMGGYMGIPEARVSLKEGLRTSHTLR